MKPAKLRRSREELQKEAEANFIPEDAENPFESLRDRCTCELGLLPCQLHGWLFPGTKHRATKLPCHVPNCKSPECDRWHEGEE